jgi:hypothetical protein
MSTQPPRSRTRSTAASMPGGARSLRHGPTRRRLASGPHNVHRGRFGRSPTVRRLSVRRPRTVNGDQRCQNGVSADQTTGCKDHRPRSVSRAGRIRLTGQLVRPALRHLRRKSWTGRFNVMRHLRSWRLRASTTGLMLSAFTSTSPRRPCCRGLSLAVWRTSIGHVELLSKIGAARKNPSARCARILRGAGAARFGDRCGHAKHPC